MKILVLTRNPDITTLCRKAFTDVAANVSEKDPLTTLESPIESEWDAVRAVTDNISAATHVYKDYAIYVSVEGGLLKDNKSLSKTYILALRDRRVFGMPISIAPVRILNKQDEKTEILAGLRTLIAMPRKVPTPDELKFLPAYQ